MNSSYEQKIADIIKKNNVRERIFTLTITDLENMGLDSQTIQEILFEKRIMVLYSEIMQGENALQRNTRT